MSRSYVFCTETAILKSSKLTGRLCSLCGPQRTLQSGPELCFLKVQRVGLGPKCRGFRTCGIWYLQGFHEQPILMYLKHFYPVFWLHFNIAMFTGFSLASCMHISLSVHTDSSKEGSIILCLCFRKPHIFTMSVK